MGTFSGIDEKSVSVGGSYFQPGRYRVKIEGVKVQKSLKGKLLWIIETLVNESNNPDIKVGSHYSQVIDINNMMGFPNIKGFIAAATGFDASKYDNEELNAEICEAWKELVGKDIELEEICEYVSGEDQPLTAADTELDLECINVLTKEKRDFTKHIWRPIP